MVTIAQVQHGLARYIDEEFIDKMGGWQKWIFGAGAAIAVEQMPQIIEQYKGNEIVKMLGVIDEHDHIDIDKVYNSILPQARKGAVTLNLPMVGAVTIDDGDVEKLYRMILNS